MGRINKSEQITFERIWSMPNKNTFEIKPIKELILGEVNIEKLWIDPFANRNKIAAITNDLNPKYDTDYHLDALDFLKKFEDNSIDGVLYDPPYSPRQVSECYNDIGYSVTWDTTKASFWGNHKREISRIVKIGGKVITFGWNSGGIGYKYGFEICKILLVAHGGWHNDTICTVEIKTHEGTHMKEVQTNNNKIQEKMMISEIDSKLISQLEILPSDYWDFKDNDTKEYTHGIHNYPAMMVSPISRKIIALMQGLMPVNSLLDPFSGSGTVLVEGMLAGLDSVAGSDINPLALLLTKAKTTPLNIEKLKESVKLVVERIDAKIKVMQNDLAIVDDYILNTMELDITSKNGWGAEAPKYLHRFCQERNIELTIPDFKNMGYWFRPNVIMTLAVIKESLNKIEDEDIKKFIFVAFSETLRLVSNRRNGEFKMYRMPVAKVLKHQPNVTLEFYKLLNRNIEKMVTFVERLQENPKSSNVSIFNNNACLLEDVSDNYYNLIITSPPYGDSRTTVAYGEFSRLSLQWIDLFELSDKEIMGVDKSLMGGEKYRNGFEYTLKSPTLREALELITEVDMERAGDVYSFYEDLDKSIKSISEKTRSGGYQFWVVGNRTVKNILIQTDVIILELATQYNLEYVYAIDRNIPNKVMPSQNSPTNEVGKKASTMTMEHIVILKKK